MRLQVPLFLYVLFPKVLFELSLHSFLCLLWQKDDDRHESSGLHLTMMHRSREFPTERSLFASFLQSLEIAETLHPHIGRDFESFLCHQAITLPCRIIRSPARIIFLEPGQRILHMQVHFPQ